MARAEPELSWAQVLSWRMDRQLLDRPDVDTMTVVRRLAGVHAQVPSATEQAVAVRRAGAVGGVAQVLADRSAVRTWAMRGTLHVLAADEAGAYLALLAAARSWERGPWQRQFATAEQMAELAGLVAEVLPGNELGREELVEAVLARTGDETLAGKLRSGWGMLLKPLAWQGLLCHAPGSGARAVFTSPSTLLPAWTGLPDPTDAAAVAIPAYLGAYGPASPEAFDGWLFRGAVPKKVRAGQFAALVEAGALRAVRVEGRQLYARSNDVADLELTRPTDRVRLLPAFDQYVLGPGTGDPHQLDAARRALVSKAAGWISPVVVAGGRVSGTWEVDGERLSVALFAESAGLDRDALAAEVGVLERVLDRQLVPTVTEV